MAEGATGQQKETPQGSANYVKFMEKEKGWEGVLEKAKKLVEDADKLLETKSVVADKTLSGGPFIKELRQARELKLWADSIYRDIKAFKSFDPALSPKEALHTWSKSVDKTERDKHDIFARMVGAIDDIDLAIDFFRRAQNGFEDYERGNVTHRIESIQKGTRSFGKIAGDSGDSTTFEKVKETRISKAPDGKRKVGELIRQGDI